MGYPNLVCLAERDTSHCAGRVDNRQQFLWFGFPTRSQEMNASSRCVSVICVMSKHAHAWQSNLRILSARACRQRVIRVNIENKIEPVRKFLNPF
jgi:hypothetical protein